MKKTVFYLLLASTTILVACKDKKAEIKENMHKNINIAYTLLENASVQPETDLHVPMGFRLNSSNDEFNKHCDELIKANGGNRKDYEGGATFYIKTKEFGGVEREVRMSSFPYFSDPNTETDTLAEIAFIFDEFRDDFRSNGGWEVLRDSISSKFDNSWETVEFNLDDADYDGEEKRYDMSNEYYKYWVKGNVAIEFYYDGFPGYATLSFYNMPKYGTSHFKEKVNMTLDIQEEVKQQLEREKNLPKITNSPWDGSVWQVEEYLKKNLKDPDSYQGIEWSTVIEKDNGYQVRHKYRAKNSFGGYVVENCIFTLTKEGTVIDVKQIP